MDHNYTIQLHPYENKPGKVYISLETGYGYWEYSSGAEGGGLWFEDVDGVCELVDFDGAGVLPGKVVLALRGHGFRVDSNFD